MKILRSKEALYGLLYNLITAAILSIVGFAYDFKCGITAISVCTVMIIVHIFITEKRYKKIAQLSDDLDKVLSGGTLINLDKYSEGELSILHNQIQKITMMLFERQENLVNEKAYLSDSLADISHQIRTPLTSINLQLEMLMNPEIDDQTRRKLYYSTVKMLERIEYLVNSLLKISKLDAGTLQFRYESVSMEELIKGACEPLLVSMDIKGQELILDIQEHVYFSCDKKQTLEALSNIIKNCYEHTPKGGLIKITADRNPLYAQFIISDNGTGISEKDLPHIFERFYKSKNTSSNNAGIGLALSKAIITAQNGTIKAENNHNRGSKFIIRFYYGSV